MTEQAEDRILSILKDVQVRLARLDAKIDGLQQQFQGSLARIDIRLGLIEPDA
jgi:hypothetical protein